MGNAVHFVSEGRHEPSLDGMPTVGDRVGIYHLTGMISVGARSVIYDAAHLGLGFRMPVAVKVLRTTSPRALLQLRNATRNVGRFGGPHVVRIFDVGSLPAGQPYVVMDRLVGEDLEKHLEMHGPLPPAIAADVMVQLCAGLAVPHRNGIFHGSLDPSRIIVRPRPDGTLRAAILGLESGAEARAGYASPEQLGKHAIDPSTDVWALGLLLYEMITGKRPFAVRDLAAMRLAVLDGPLPDLKSPRGPVPPVLGEIVRRATMLHRGGRFPTVDKLAFALAPLAVRAVRPPPMRPVLAETVVSPRRSVRAARSDLATTIQRSVTDVAATVVHELPRLDGDDDEDESPTTQRDECAFGSAHTAISERAPRTREHGLEETRERTREKTMVSRGSDPPSPTSLPKLGHTVMLPPAASPPPMFTPALVMSMAQTMPPAPRLEPFPSVPPPRYEPFPTLSPEVLPRRRWGWLVAVPLVAAGLIAAVVAIRPALRRGAMLASSSITTSMAAR
jgi:serine/threonine protein kinase